MNRLFPAFLVKQQAQKFRFVRKFAENASKTPLFTNQMKDNINNHFTKRNSIQNNSQISIATQSKTSKQISNNFEAFASKMNKESEERKKFRSLIQEKQNLMTKFRHRDLSLEGGISIIEELYKLDAPFTNRDVETITNYLLDNKLWELMLKLYSRITQAQLYSQFGYNFLIAFAELNMENECHELLLSIIKQYNVIDKKACNSLFSMYLRQNDFTGLYNIYNEITRNNIYLKLNQYQLSSISCELLNALYKYKHYKFAIEKYNEYDRNGITFDAMSMNSVLCSYYHLHNYVDCLRIYHEMTLSKFTPNLDSYYHIINILENGYIWDKVYYEIKNVEMLINNNNNNNSEVRKVETDYFRDITIVLKNHAFSILKKGISDNVIILNSKIHSNIDKINISNIPKGVCRTVFRYVLYRNYKRLYNVGNHSLCSISISSDSDNIIEIERMILEYSFFPLRFKFDPKNNEIFINKADLHDFFEYVNNNGIWLM